MRITIIAVGKVKEAFYRDAIAEYTKRLSRYAKVHIIEVADEQTPDHMSIIEEEQIKEKEAIRICKHFKEDAYRIALAIEGKQRDSISFSKHMESRCLYDTSHLQFIIGGSLGLSKTILSQVDEHMSFSKMTFPHQLMRVVLLEQIYRGFRIMKGEPYHK
ncbi:MAG: 23S rRNA (pseudouridine(1915)-N(3))-methyltransferase RlmH [Eubacteriales bacterium]